MAELSILGSGAWGTALALAQARAGRRVRLWGRNPARVEDLARTRRNSRDLPGVDLPETIQPTAELALAAATSLLLVAVPTQALRTVLARLGRFDGTLVLCCKGLERGTLARPSAVARETLPGARVAVLSGPSFAHEVARGLPTALTLAAPSQGAARALARDLAETAFRLYPTDDVVGVEIGGALKNVIAIASGAVMGRGLGENARAALVTRGLAETARLAEALGARRETLMGLSGLGDLVLSATSLASRNTRFGHELGRGRAVAELLAPDAPLAEGAWTAPAAADLAARLGIDMPITAAVAAVVLGRSDVGQAVEALLARPLAERE